MKTILVDAADALFVDAKVFEAMKTMLDTFANRKLVLTNANDEQIESFGINKSPYEVFSLKHNPDKTDSIYYQKMLSHYNLTSDEVIYFEHAEAAVKSAESVGIKSYHYDSGKQDLESLKKFLMENLK
jgi:FMN phosphatase YigB (HAD superfamily)